MESNTIFHAIFDKHESGVRICQSETGLFKLKNGQSMKTRLFMQDHYYYYSNYPLLYYENVHKAQITFYMSLFELLFSILMFGSCDPHTTIR